jgi:hypothetical protein
MVLMTRREMNKVKCLLLQDRAHDKQELKNVKKKEEGILPPASSSKSF